MWVHKVTGEKMQDMQFYHTMTKKDSNWERIAGFMLTYIYFIDKNKKKDLSVKTIPFEKIKEMGASMYKGERT